MLHEFRVSLALPRNNQDRIGNPLPFAFIRRRPQFHTGRFEYRSVQRGFDPVDRRTTPWHPLTLKRAKGARYPPQQLHSAAYDRARSPWHVSSMPGNVCKNRGAVGYHSSLVTISHLSASGLSPSRRTEGCALRHGFVQATVRSGLSRAVAMTHFVLLAGAMLHCWMGRRPGLCLWSQDLFVLGALYGTEQIPHRYGDGQVCRGGRHGSQRRPQPIVQLCCLHGWTSTWGEATRVTDVPSIVRNRTFRCIER